MRDDTGTNEKGRTLVVKRADAPPVETREIRGLAEAAGYEVVGVETQVRAEDPGTNLGRGKVVEIAEQVEERDLRAVVLDNDLTPNQHLTLAEAMPDGTRLRDRYRLILDIFGEQAPTKRAKRPVELARLRYDLPIIEERTDVAPLNRWSEKGSPVYDVRDRIDTLERKLDELPDPAEQFRERRREEGFDLVTIAGYTNAGKSTLLHRLADDLDLADHEPDHPDEDSVAAIEDRLFKTLETTTRRATIGGRPMLLTDTVGFVDDLPHDLVASFSETLSEAAAADAVILVADASDPVDTLREKLRVSMDVLTGQGVDREAILTVLNKVDLLEDAVGERRREAAEAIAPSVIPVSVLEGRNVDAIRQGVLERVPTDRAELRMPTGDDAMSLVSWAYDNAAVEDVTYDADEVSLRLRGRPSVVRKAVAKAPER